ncbi:MAG: aspartate-semialdehyde dehydrogenase, partial [Candidatus Eisenbacteria bacterium]|nr:aspartate-semialdehyde dehydrogenase [Candidatus Eisenbacteria bacterium]
PAGAGARAEEIVVEPLSEEAIGACDLVLLSAGGDVAREWVPRLAERKIWAIDNSSAFRMDPGVPLIVPEVNGAELPATPGPIANPNCSTIQMVVALAPLARAFGLERVHVATYQSVSGRGQKGIVALEAERRGERDPGGAFPHAIDQNVIPQCDVFLADGVTREEEKMIRETRKILSLPDLPVHVTCARVAVPVSHSEAVHATLGRAASREEVIAVLRAAPGVKVADDPEKSVYPTPARVAGTNEVWVGRVRQDRCDPRIAALWIVADNLRKGAAWNAVQIASAIAAREG